MMLWQIAMLLIFPGIAANFLGGVLDEEGYGIGGALLVLSALAIFAGIIVAFVSIAITFNLA